MVPVFGKSRIRAYVGEETAGSVPEGAGVPGVRSIPGKGVYTWKGGTGTMVSVSRDLREESREKLMQRKELFSCF